MKKDGKNNAKIDLRALLSVGYDPKTGLPKRCDELTTEQNVSRIVEIIDRQDALNRYVWSNMPDGIGEIIELILYYRGTCCVFTLADKAYALPFSLVGGIDEYGRYKSIRPLTFNGALDGSNAPLLDGLTLHPRYNVELPEDFEGKKIEKIEKYIEESAVIIWDYSRGLTQQIPSRAELNRPVISFMGECFPLVRTALFNSTGVSGVRCDSEDEYTSIEAQSRAANEAALRGEKWVGLTSSLNVQELTGGNVAKAEEFLMVMQSLDNFRLSTYGLDNGGLFLKRSHVLEAEQRMNSGVAGLSLKDGLAIRQNACDILNSIFGWGCWCEISESAIGADWTGDGIAGSDEKMRSPMKKAEQGGEVKEDG